LHLREREREREISSGGRHMYVAVSHGSMAYRHVGTGGSPPSWDGEPTAKWQVRKWVGDKEEATAASSPARWSTSTHRTGAGTPRARGGGRRGVPAGVRPCAPPFPAPPAACICMQQNLPVYLSAPLGGCLQDSLESYCSCEVACMFSSERVAPACNCTRHLFIRANGAMAVGSSEDE
jgi:hypothetical protein